MMLLDTYLRGPKSVAVAGHIRPDGDCVGSCLAVYNYIRDRFPEIRTALYLEPIPEKFSFLKNADQIRQANAEENPFVYDLFIALDCGDINRLGGAAGLFRAAKRTICIDHHLTNGGFADVNEVCPNASSTSELIWHVLDRNAVTYEIAECLYLGIAHDTGIFRYSCTSAETMKTAGELMSRGIDFTKLIDETYYIRTYAQQKIWGKALLDSRLFLDGKCIYSAVTRADMDAFGVTAADLDGIVSELRSTAGVEVSVFLYEMKDGYKISMRSASYVDVARIALEFGGGGHARAAGASAVGDAETIRDRLLSEIEEQLCITES